MDPTAELAALDAAHEEARTARRRLDADERTAHEAVAAASATVEDHGNCRLMSSRAEMHSVAGSIRASRGPIIN
jgi:hypothetical protein